VNHGGGSIMLRGISLLCGRSWKACEGKINAAKHTKVLEENLMGSAKHLQEKICFPARQ